MASSSVLILFSILAELIVEAAVVPDSNRCELGCPPPLTLHPRECRCVDGVIEVELCPLIRCPLTFVPCDEYKNDENGCPTCQCLCSGLLSHCPVDCPNGVEHTTNSNGCRVCQCRGSMKVCPQLYCESDCPTTRINDPNGCPTCKCANA